jgi:AcrR family transcriptional regulator
MARGPGPVPAAATDRRHRRRQETIEEILDIAVQIMAEQGVAGLSVGEIARRMGIRPPSVYVYFPSKHALYDALFARGARLLLAAMQQVFAALPARPATLEEILLPASRAFVRWSVEQAAYSQLLFWRPVPGFTPSPEAYEAAIELIELARDRLRGLQDIGLLRAGVPVEQMERDWTILLAGVFSQQLANAPQQGFDEGGFTAAIPELMAMFAGYYSPRPSAPETGRHEGQRRQAPARPGHDKEE